ncbi:hypothetical protein niasHT_018726 [Heterodera trifolii]|uniref:BTB domain-containing protein n=1 Tax=Heterodera trifolii TaxID=157864 RepID=A0ABD2LBB2_9BILA
MSFSLNSIISEFTADQAIFVPFEAFQRARITELERLQKMNSEKGNGSEENDSKMKTEKPEPLADRMKLLLSTAKFADTHFLVGQNDKKELVLAHRAILSASSDVFEAMFQKEATENANGKIGGKTSAEKDGPMLVPDVDAEAFKVMLRFIYSDDLSELNGQNAAEVLYAALKFNVIGLIKALADFPIPKLSHVFAALSFARFNELIFFLALRWSDTKCRQNGIECSALNRRAMLGPALFKIRFPLLSNEAFSKTIVPSDMLSKDEVIAVYQFHTLPNRRGIFNGFFPMPFPTNGRISDQKKGTLLMDIEKVSEFAREEVESSRWYSEKVYINGHPWKICAENDKDENNDNMLYIFLLCDAPEKDKHWNCKCSGNVRIVSQKNEVLGFKKVFVDLVFDNENSLQCVKSISFAELMDPSKGLYDKKEDKVTLAIDVTVKEAKMEETNHKYPICEKSLYWRILLWILLQFFGFISANFPWKSSDVTFTFTPIRDWTIRQWTIRQLDNPTVRTIRQKWTIRQWAIRQ